jgi:hypothetical protein
LEKDNPPPGDGTEGQAKDVNNQPEVNPSSPACELKSKIAADEATTSPPQGDLTITRTEFKAPKPSQTLVKVVSKGESQASIKGKEKLELSDLEGLNAAELHETFLTQLSESRNMEANMVNMLIQKYEVCLEPWEFTT